MSKKIKIAMLTCALASVVAVSASLSACTIKTKHPGAKITVEFNSVSYEIDYTLYRNMYPQTVQHFIELADAGFYNNMIVHNYTASSDWFTGAYSYNADESLAYATASTNKTLAEYLEKNEKEKAYYDLASGDKLTPTVYDYGKLTYNSDGKAEVTSEGKLATLIGEFSSNNHVVEQNGLTAQLGALKMFYYSDDDDANKKAAIVNSFNQVLIHDYKYNRATSIFSMQMGSSTSYSESSYCVFATLKNDGAKEKLNDLLEAVSDYISDNGLSSTFTTSVTTTVDKLDVYSNGGLETKFTMTATPIIIKSVEITKY
ncbi:MAG: hypothetical protein K2L12_07535 [Clostridia bacterium]|nr:hypothetical protein [Clostridia bacterium]